ncbi:pyruvate dehydrogenase complex dihydrolipoamide acetyltransferase [Anaeromyxobacter dehalogenans 2CP-1]|uniref:Acetyltransferase component of pyruvate dehydrogenase complex n=1 Tax=Anaeromyxobacter dehalogenans (strain ATCC BAA-258 / DSM 21875 / 2CP-1) TaxID=455488 RepID=B8J6I7_ANAD2|nr:dihydrolipoyllysine-residue acetyltransferase [Anaeromyxobacter dehalogenans]ACL65168.1 pyruvate dehydrogenase complex dihydrolipoamide acetyltransferase [Anaeromyxobacter dehalogenans 2CP-1]
MRTIEVKVPNIGDYKDVPVIDVLVKPGEQVDADAPLVTLESDKATLDVPAPAAGTIREVKVKVGDRVSEGSLVVTLEASDGQAKAEAPAAPAQAAPPKPAAAAPAPAPSPAPAAPSAPPAAASPAGAPRTVEVKVPNIGDFKDVPVIEVLVKPGDRVEADAPLATLESEKATLDVPAPAAGTIREVALKAGDKVSEGSLVAILDAVAPAAATTAAAPAPSQPAAAPAAKAAAPPPAPSPAAPPVAPETGAQGQVPHASPSVRKLARELGVNLGRVEGSGPRGRILQDDVQKFVKASLARLESGGGGGGALDLAPWPKVDFTRFGPVERQPLSRIRKLSRTNLARNWVMIPHVTQFDEADITELERFRVELNREHEKQGVKVTLLAFLVKACVAAMRRFPELNASLDGDELVLKRYFHVGFAADTPQGLVVPVLKDADQKGVLQLAKELGELAAKARDGKLSPADVQGGCFSISSLGGIGGTAFTPIINAPEVAILGVSRSAMRPVWDGTQFQPRLMLPLSLSYDHRVIDGALAARITTYLAQLLGDMRRIVL